MTYYFVLFLLVFALLLLYFRLADKFNIIDKPNERSSHSKITIRGGGVAYLIAGIAFVLYTGFTFPWFWTGFFIIAALSFVDDIKTLSSKVRLPLQLLAVLMLLYQGMQGDQSILIWFVALIIATGIINAYNFMDGINGITAGYSFVVLSSLLMLNQKMSFVDDAFIITFIIADVVFAFFNFRKKAKCFAGDVGSVSIAFVIVFLLLKVIMQTGNIFYILFLAVYGVDSVLTIIYRLKKRENIFEAHRSHLYQWLVKPGPFTHLQIAGIYMLIQAIISLGVILLADASMVTQLLFSAVSLLVLAVVYISIKLNYKTKYGLV